MKTKSQIFKSKFPEFIGDVEVYKYDQYGDTSDIITHINVPGNWAGYRFYFTAECGCCTDSDTDSDLLAHVLDDLSDNEFDELCDDIAKKV
jgi:hypothetical protein